MAGNSAFVLVKERGWRGGLGNMLRAESGRWWKTRRWWVQSLVWTAVINLILAGIVWQETDTSLTEQITLCMIFIGLFPSIATIIIMQDTIVAEKEAGTAAWVLSKPLSRSAFVLSKLIANSAGVFVCMLFFPFLVAYLQISLAHGALLSPLNFLSALGALAVYMLYYLTLTLMLGTFFDQRPLVIGIPLALVFGQQMLFGLLPALSRFLPWTIAVPFGDQDLSIAGALALNQPTGDLTPLYVSAVSILVFIAVGLWRFERQEF
jgi:ABC-2 type transport system permease protein